MNTKRNRPIATLLKEYSDKQSGKVSFARDELRHRFPYQDWSMQKKIVLAFLASCKSDRTWMYTQLLDLWDDSFAAIIQQLWEEHQEERCGWLVIRYQPEDYLLAHQNEFKGARDYYFLCCRLAVRDNFAIDKSRLSPVDYLSVIAKTKREVTKEDVNDALCRALSNLRDTDILFLEDRFNVLNTESAPSPTDFKDIYRAQMRIEELGDSAIMLATRELLDSLSGKMAILWQSRFHISINKKDRIQIALDAISDFLPEGYTTAKLTQQHTGENLQQLVEKHPSLATLVEGLNLELSPEPPF